MSLSTARLPVLVDSASLMCDVCKQKLRTAAIVGVEERVHMWSTEANVKKHYSQHLTSRIACLACEGRQPWPAIPVHLCYFPCRQQYFLRERGAPFLAAYRTARLTYDKLRQRHNVRCHWDGHADHCKRMQTTRSLQRKLMNEKMKLRLLAAQSTMAKKGISP